MSTVNREFPSPISCETLPFNTGDTSQFKPEGRGEGGERGENGERREEVRGEGGEEERGYLPV